MPESTISTKQIRDGAVTAIKVAAGAGIETSKLADGAEFIQRGGGVAFTGNQSLGNNKITNLATPTPASNDAARIVDVENAVAGLSSIYKFRNARVASTANITLSNPGTASFDGVTLNNGEKILVKNQTAPAENGIYVFNGSGSAMTRDPNTDTWADFPGMACWVSEGAQASADGIAKFFCPVDDGGTLNTTAITFTLDASSGLTASNFVDKETPSGTINGSNVTFTLANTPTAGTEHLYLNGILQRSGSGNDYTISTNTITFTTAPVSGDILLASYRK